MAKRTDIHRAGEVRPADYQIVCEFSAPTADDPLGYGWKERLALVNRAIEAGTWFPSPNGGCVVCGALFQHGALALHEPTGQLVEWGWICAGKLEILGDWDETTYKAWKKNQTRERAIAIQERRHAAAFEADVEGRGLGDDVLKSDDPTVADIVKKARRYGGFKSDAQVKFAQGLVDAAVAWRAILDGDALLVEAIEKLAVARDRYALTAEENDAGEPVFVIPDEFGGGTVRAYAVGDRADVGEFRDVERLPAIHYTAESIVEKAKRWGSLSDSQRALVLNASGVEDPDAPEIPEAPEGRVVIEGRVVGLKTYASDFGDVEKMIVRAAEGWKVYVSVPRDIGDVPNPDYDAENDPERYATRPRQVSELTGCEVSFSATLTRSDRDASFAFGKRPTKFKVTADAPAADETSG